MGGQEIAARLPRELRKEVVRPDRDDHLAERRGRSIEPRGIPRARGRLSRENLEQLNVGAYREQWRYNTAVVARPLRLVKR